MIAYFCCKEGLTICSSKGVIFWVKVVLTTSAMSLRCLHKDLRVVLISSIACIVEVGVICQNLRYFLITPIKYLGGLPWLAMFMTQGTTFSFHFRFITLVASTYAHFSFGQFPRALDNSYM